MFNKFLHIYTALHLSRSFVSTDIALAKREIKLETEPIGYSRAGFSQYFPVVTLLQSHGTGELLGYVTSR